MRIINIITQMEAGGAQGAAIRMAQEMRNRGIDAETWFLYKKLDTYINDEKVEVIYDSPPTNIYNAIKITYLLYKKLKTNLPDGVVCYTHYSCVLGTVAAWLSGVKNRVATLRNPVWTFPRGARLMDKLLGATSVYTRIIAVSETVKESCEKYSQTYKDKIKVVFNGVPPRISKLTREQARNLFNIEIGNKQLLINVGRLHPQKNQEVLIKMMPLLPNYHLAIAGGGELREYLLNLSKELNVSDRVSFFGEIPPNNIPDFLRAGDLFVFSSIYEAFGFAIFEAAYNDLPIVASNIPSTVELLELKNEMGGIIVKDMEINSWANAVIEMEDTDLRERYKNIMKQKLVLFDFNKMVEAYIKSATEK